MCMGNVVQLYPKRLQVFFFFSHSDYNPLGIKSKQEKYKKKLFRLYLPLGSFITGRKTFHTMLSHPQTDNDIDLRFFSYHGISNVKEPIPLRTAY